MQGSPAVADIPPDEAAFLRGGAPCETSAADHNCEECANNEAGNGIKCSTIGNKYKCVPWSGPMLICQIFNEIQCGGNKEQYDTDCQHLSVIYGLQCTRTKNDVNVNSGPGTCP